MCSLTLFVISLTISCVTNGRSTLLLICLVGICRVDYRLNSALNMSHRWFGSLCLCVASMLVKMAMSFFKSDQSDEENREQGIHRKIYMHYCT